MSQIETKGEEMRPERRPLIITGATGTLGRAFARACEIRGIPYRLLKRSQMDIASVGSVRAALDTHRPWALINAAGYVRVDQAETEYVACFRENSQGAATLAAACAERKVKLLTFSSDLVFDGLIRRPYVESDQPEPLNIYGQSKATAEALVLSADAEALVIRTSAFFGPWDQYNFIFSALRTVASGRVFVAADDAVVSPTYVPDLVRTSLDLLIDDERGLWHLANEGAVSWAEFAQLAATLAGLDVSYVDGCPTHALGLSARRPPYSVLSSERGAPLPSLDEALHRYLSECEPKWMFNPENESSSKVGCAGRV